MSHSDPQGNPQLFPLREIRSYGSLGFFVTQENPYEFNELQVQFIDLREEEELKDLQVVNTANASAGVPEMDQGVVDTLNQKFEGSKGIQRFGWLGGASVFKASKGRRTSPASPLDDSDAPKNSEIYLCRDDETHGTTYLTKTGKGLQFLPRNDPEKDEPDDRIRIAKVVSIPYRWRRPGETADKTRQVDLYIGYNGPSY